MEFNHEGSTIATNITNMGQRSTIWETKSYQSLESSEMWSLDWVLEELHFHIVMEWIGGSGMVKVFTVFMPAYLYMPTGFDKKKKSKVKWLIKEEKMSRNLAGFVQHHVSFVQQVA